MDVNHYLKDLVTECPKYTISGEESKTIAYEGVQTFIFNKLNSSKFKSSALPETLKQEVKEKINKSVIKNKPIHITVPFGGYKKWQFPTYPNPDWSEVFYLVLLRDYLTPIAVNYKYGVFLEFFSDEVFVSRMNNIPQTDLDMYNNQMCEIVNWFQKYLPKNFNIKFSRIRDQINQAEILKRFDKDIVKLKKEWTKLPKKEREFRLRKSERNYKGDLSNLSTTARKKKLLESTMVHDAFIFGEWDKDIPWAFDELMIAIGNRYTGSWGIHIKSSKSSTNQFWVGMGALKKTGSHFVPTSLTYNQYLSFKSGLKEVNVNVFPDKYIGLTKIFVLSI